MMLNNKAQIADWISSVLVFMGVVAIMGIFVILSTGLFGVKSISGRLDAANTGDIRIADSALLFEHFSRDIKNSSVIISSQQDEPNLANDLSRLTPENGCLALVISKDISDISYIDYVPTNFKSFYFKNDLGTTKKINDFPTSLTNYWSYIPVSFVDSKGNYNNFTYSIYRGECIE